MAGEKNTSTEVGCYLVGVLIGALAMGMTWIVTAPVPPRPPDVSMTYSELQQTEVVNQYYGRALGIELWNPALACYDLRQTDALVRAEGNKGIKTQGAASTSVEELRGLCDKTGDGISDRTGSGFISF